MFLFANTYSPLVYLLGPKFEQRNASNYNMVTLTITIITRVILRSRLSHAFLNNTLGTQNIRSENNLGTIFESPANQSAASNVAPMQPTKQEAKVTNGLLPGGCHFRRFSLVFSQFISRDLRYSLCLLYTPVSSFI